jgi:hypothetical protein
MSGNGWGCGEVSMFIDKSNIVLTRFRTRSNAYMYKSCHSVPCLARRVVPLQVCASAVTLTYCTATPSRRNKIVTVCRIINNLNWSARVAVAQLHYLLHNYVPHAWAKAALSWSASGLQPRVVRVLPEVDPVPQPVHQHRSPRMVRILFVRN